MRIFFGGPLTNLKDGLATKEFYTKMADVATHNGFDYYWAWQRGTDPDEDPEVPASRVYQIDSYELEKSDMMVAYVGEPSTGTGIEIEYARRNRIPVVIMYEKGRKISRMLRGCPSVKFIIEYDTHEEALAQLDAYLKYVKKI